MALDMYLTIPSSATGGAPERIHVYEFSWGDSTPASLGSESAEPPADGPKTFNIVKKADRTTETLFQGAADGQHIADARLVMEKVTGSDSEEKIALVYNFTDLMVKSIQFAGGDEPTVSATFAFEKVSISTVKADGTTTPGTASWDLTKGT